ncbi:30S ribosome-binding factor RbfA [bacterium]|nr:30S ribosome-binding factor RbfA [bacterium]
MDPYKLERQGSAIRKVLADLIATEVKDPRVGFVSVGRVALNRDQTVAEVLVSVIGDDGERRSSLAGLKKARGFLQGRLSDILRLRHTPDLRFVYDDSLDWGLSVEGILEDLSEQGEFEDEATRNRKRDLASLEPPPDLMRAIGAGRRFWLVPHWNPDPDSMGSALALAEALRAAGKEVSVFTYPDPPHGFASLPGYDEAVPAEQAPALLSEAPPDVLIMCDCHHVTRAGDDLGALLTAVDEVWCIDHHMVSDGPAPLPGWIEPLASSASLLILRVVEALAAGQVPGADPFAMTPDMATNIYAGVYADTGGFRFPNVLPMTFEAARQLAAAGVDTAEVAERMLHQRSQNATELLKHVMATFAFHDGGRILSLRADGDMMSATGTSMSDTEGLIGLASGTAGVRFVVFLKEREDGRWRISLRAREGGDVQRVAARYGGGGHVLAAGCTIDGDHREIIEELVAALSEQLPR